MYYYRTKVYVNYLHYTRYFEEIMMKIKTKLTRRQWFSRLGRLGGLAGIAGLIGYLGYKRRIDYQKISCVNDGYCRICKLLDKCELPEAREEKALL